MEAKLDRSGELSSQARREGGALNCITGREMEGVNTHIIPSDGHKNLYWKPRRNCSHFKDEEIGPEKTDTRSQLLTVWLSRGLNS